MNFEKYSNEMYFLLFFSAVIDHVSDGSSASGLSTSKGKGLTSSFTASSLTGNHAFSPSAALPSTRKTLMRSDKNSVNSNNNLTLDSSKTSNGSDSEKVVTTAFKDVTMGDAPVVDTSSLASVSSSGERDLGTSEPAEGTSPNKTLAEPTPPPAGQQQTPRKGYPFIDTASSPNVTALLGKTAYLACRVKHLGDKTVSSSSHNVFYYSTFIK